MRFLIRADAGAKMGSGHLVRCFALAQEMVSKGHSVSFYSHKESRIFSGLIKYPGIFIRYMNEVPGSVGDQKRTCAFVKEMGVDWLILDGYQFKTRYFKAIKKVGVRLLIVDDYGHASSYFGDILLNQNCYAKKSLYSRRVSNMKLLLGSDYLLLRRDFLDRRRIQKSFSKKSKNILVTFGGGDHKNATQKVLEEIRNLKKDVPFSVKVLVGHANPHIHQLKGMVRKFPFPLKVLEATPRVVQHMHWADLAITSGGSASWELAYLGVPNVVLPLESNQRFLGRAVQKKGAAICLEDWESGGLSKLGVVLRKIAEDRKELLEMSRNAMCLVDGKGAERVLNILQPTITLRRASMRDLSLLFEWRNDPLTRVHSHNAKKVGIQEHQQWLKSTLKNPDRQLFVAEESGVPVGSMRVDCLGGAYKLSWTVSPSARGRGVGKRMLWILANNINGSITAEIKVGNTASEKIATHVGMQWEFEKDGVNYFRRPHIANSFKAVNRGPHV